MITPVGPGTMTDFLSVRIVDCWVHEQDARRALDMPGNESGAAAEHSIDRLLRSLPMVVGKRAACPEGRAVAFELTGPVRRQVTCEVHDGRAVVVDLRPAPLWRRWRWTARPTWCSPTDAARWTTSPIG